MSAEYKKIPGKASEIQKMIKNRGITRLCHMTEVDNLYSILRHDNGILASDYINIGVNRRNDQYRFDGKTDYISTSIQYPNVWYYNMKKGRGDWCTIFIDTDICDINQLLFSPVNASTARGAYIGTDVGIFMNSFGECVRGRRRTEKMLLCCPTDDQAEIMVYRKISLRYVKGIAFESKEAINRFVDIAKKIGIEWPSLYLAPALFSTSLSRNIRIGVKPVEVIAEKESKSWQKDLCF